MPTHGSCRPLVMTSVGVPSMRIDLRGDKIDDVGLTANRTTMSWPVLIPPRMPPE